MSDRSSSDHAPLSSLTAQGSEPPYANSSSTATTDWQTSERAMSGRLEFVATPIGNLADMTHRGVATLRDAALILCEDTRVTAKLLQHFAITTPTQTLHEHNEEERIPFMIEKLRNGAVIAVVSDAGTPMLSDPGFRLARAAIAADIPVSGTPGANAAAFALTLSGLPPQPYLFLGFPPPKSQARKTAFAHLRAAEQAGLKATLIWYEAPHRLLDTLDDMITVFGRDRPAAVGRELTKRFEEMVRGTTETVHTHFSHHAPRGEITVLLGPPEAEETGTDDLDRQLREALATLSVKDAATLVAGIVHLPRRAVYARAMELAREG